MSPYRLHWNVPYEAGELKVVGYIDGKKVTEKQIKTAGKPAKIELIPDRNLIKSDGEDMVFVTVRIVDKEGNLCPNSDNLIEFEIEGDEFDINKVGFRERNIITPWDAGGCVIDSFTYDGVKLDTLEGMGGDLNRLYVTIE